MDPNTTLFTFMLQTHPSVRSVHLVGSWDNFSRTYIMERDTRRDRGQWRGCYRFRDIICDGDGGSIPRRDGGLKMGQTYYYYYELDGSSETHDPTLPSTSACPYLPGQTVNTIWVPVEQSSRKRSASLSSMRDEDLKTMKPDDKFVTPRPAPSPPEPMRRLATAPVTLHHKRSARSLSPGLSWAWSPRKLFTRTSSNTSLPDCERGRSSDSGLRSETPCEDMQSTASSEGVRSRDMSPESLRRFLSDDAPLDGDDNETCDRFPLFIPEDIAEENEDDENFATSAMSESDPFTGLSPPPTQRGQSPGSSTTTLLLTLGGSNRDMADTTIPEAPSRTPPRVPAQLHIPLSPLSPLCETSWYSPASPPMSPSSHDPPSFDHSEDEDEDVVSTNDDEFLSLQGVGSEHDNADHFLSNLAASLSTYSLPRTSLDGGKLAVESEDPLAPLGSPELIARNGTDLPVGNTSLLASPVNSGIGDLVNDLGWMAGVIRG